jgi:nucleoside phosphorylase
MLAKWGVWHCICHHGSDAVVIQFPLNSLGLDGRYWRRGTNKDADIRLGDIVVSKPTDTHGGVVQYDYDKALSGGDFQRTGMLNRPPQILLRALSKLQASHLTEESRVMDFLVQIERKIPKRASNFARPTRGDHLYLVDYDHVNINSKNCDGCNVIKIVPRRSRNHIEPIVHYGLIASANKVMKDSRLRDKLGQELGVYCVEMEAAGLMNNYPCLVIRGICDYADSHKNKEWQGYAAAVAAAYAKELLSVTSVSHIDKTRTVRDTLSDSSMYV